MPSNKDRGEWFESNDETYNAGGVKTFDLSFLDAAVAGYDFPEIAEMEVVFDGAYGDASWPALAGDDAKTFLDQLRIDDGAGQRLNLTGAQIAELERLEYGTAYNAPPTVAINTADSSVRVAWRIPWDLPNLAERGRDTAIPLTHLMNGGKVQFTQANSVNGDTGNITSGTWKLRCRVREGRKGEAKSRLVWERINVSQRETNYAINGLLRAAWFSFKDTDGSGYNDSSSITEIDSKTLDYHDREVEDHVNDYRASVRDRSSGDNFLAAATARNIPILWPEEKQKIGRMPDVRALHLKQDAAVVTDQELVYCKIVDRDVRLTALSLGLTEQQYLAEAAANGRVVSAKGKHMNPAAVSPSLAKKLPIRLG
jgi:hypothetical protein